jgi:hypothetical protein
VLCLYNQSKKLLEGIAMLRAIACLVAVLFVAGSLHTASAQTTAPAASSTPAVAKPSRMKLTADKLRDMKAKWSANQVERQQG